MSFQFLARLFGLSPVSLPEAGYLVPRSKHRRDPAEKVKTIARRRAASKVARRSRKLNRRLERIRS